MTPDADAVVHAFRISDSENAERLDKVIALRLPDRSRAQIQRHIHLGAVEVDGELPARGPKTKVRRGQRLTYTPPPPESTTLEPENIPLSIVFEDEHFLAIDKQRDLVVHPAPGHPTGTLVNAVLHHLDQGPKKGTRPGIVHRLDKGTTGLILVAKTERCQERLSALFHDRQIEKTYWAVVRGLPKPSTGRIQTLYGRHPKDRKRFSSKVARGKTATTRYKVIEPFRGASFVEVQLETGRTHQIRVHFSDLGHALIGDPTYGPRVRIADDDVRAAVEFFDRPALHARHLSFQHPITEEKMNLTAALPDDLKVLLDNLRGLGLGRT